MESRAIGGGCAAAHPVFWLLSLKMTRVLALKFLNLFTDSHIHFFTSSNVPGVKYRCRLNKYAINYLVSSIIYDKLYSGVFNWFISSLFYFVTQAVKWASLALEILGICIRKNIRSQSSLHRGCHTHSSLIIASVCQMCRRIRSK